MRSAAKAFDWPENTYKSHEQGMRRSVGLTEADAKRYARGFGVSAAWLILGHGSPKLTPQDAEWLELNDEERARALRLLKAAKWDDPGAATG